MGQDEFPGPAAKPFERDIDALREAGLPEE